jgi:hypothetical protein
VHAEATWPGLVYAPQRWKTRDGVIPYRVFCAYLKGLSAVTAKSRLEMAGAIGLAMAGENAEHAMQSDLEEAFPG